MGRPYAAAVKEYLPEIAMVFDRFHVMQLVNRTVDKVRNRQQQQLNRCGHKTLKGDRFLFLANYDDLDSSQRHRVDIALEANEPIYIMHSMKEQLRLLWAKKKRNKARKFLGTWIMDAIEVAIDYEARTQSKVLQPLRRLALSLAFHMKGILNYFDHRITNGKMEGINNKIKTLKRQSYGFRDTVYFQLRLYHLHAQRNRLSG